MTVTAWVGELSAAPGDPMRRWTTPTRAADVDGQIRKRPAPSEA